MISTSDYYKSAECILDWDQINNSLTNPSSATSNPSFLYHFNTIPSRKSSQLKKQALKWTNASHLKKFPHSMHFLQFTHRLKVLGWFLQCEFTFAMEFSLEFRVMVVCCLLMIWDWEKYFKYMRFLPFYRACCPYS